MKTNRKVTLLTYGVSLLVFLGIALYGKLFLRDGDEMGFVLLTFYMLMPFTTFVSGMFLGLTNDDLKWIYAIVFGILGILIPVFIMPNSWDWISVLFALVPALLGLVIGNGIHETRNKKAMRV